MIRQTLNALVVGALLILTACQSPVASVTHDPYTGDTIARAAPVVVHDGLLSTLRATPMHSAKIGYSVYIYHLNTGLGWQFFSQVWSAGKQYKYTVADRQTLGCGSGCTISEEGFFQMSAAEFKKAAQVGFDFKLIGKRGNISGVIPATAFQEVLKLQK